jgi:hypothetical protein
VATLDFSRLQADIARYVQRAQQEVELATAKAASYLQDQIVERARQDEQWSMLADAISVWSQDGRLVIGIHDQMLASQAFQLEFGDEHTPPSPLFRTIGPDQEVAQGIMNQSYAEGMR